MGPSLPVPVEAGRVETSEYTSEAVALLLVLAGRAPPA
jgi:hypothetical protein